jgi:VanZ family protein
MWLAGALLTGAIAVASLVPAAWRIRLGPNWLVEHFLAYFCLTAVFCLASRKPMAVAATLIPLALVLEALQALTPDRVPDAVTALFATTGVASAALLADLGLTLVRNCRRPRAKA